MNILVPEVRVNKLGFPVTKHVRSGTATPTARVPMPKLSASDVKGRKELGQQLLNLIFTFQNSGDRVVLVDSYGNDDGNDYEMKHVQEAVDEMMKISSIAYATQTVLSRDEFSKLELCLIGDQFYQRICEYCSDLEAGERSAGMSAREIQQIADCLLLADTAVDFTAPSSTEAADALRAMHKASSAFYRRAALSYNTDEPEYADGLRFAYLLTELTDAEALPEWVHKDEVLDTTIERNVEFRAQIEEVNAHYDLIKEHQDVCRERNSLDIGLLKLVDKSDAGALRAGLL